MVFTAQVWRTGMLFLTKGTLRRCHNKYGISLWHVAVHEEGLIKIWLHSTSASDSMTPVKACQMNHTAIKYKALS